MAGSPRIKEAPRRAGSRAGDYAMLFGRQLSRGQLVLYRDALEVFVWMLDPILRLSVSRQRGSYYVHAIGLAVPTIRVTVSNDVADLELVGHL
jgi:hypothetical protein